MATDARRGQIVVFLPLTVWKAKRQSYFASTVYQNPTPNNNELQSNPLRSRFLVRGLAVRPLSIQLDPGRRESASRSRPKRLGLTGPPLSRLLLPSRGGVSQVELGPKSMLVTSSNAVELNLLLSCFVIIYPAASTSSATLDFNWDRCSMSKLPLRIEPAPDCCCPGGSSPESPDAGTMRLYT